MDSKTIISIVVSIIILSGLYFLVKGGDLKENKNHIEKEKIQKVEKKNTEKEDKK